MHGNKRLTENDGHENDGLSKLQDMKLRDQMTGHVIAGHEFAGHKNAMHEIAGHENATHEIGGQTTESSNRDYIIIHFCCYFLNKKQYGALGVNDYLLKKRQCNVGPSAL